MENLQNVYAGLLLLALLVAIVFGVVGILPAIALFSFKVFAVMGLMLWPFLVVTDLLKG